ncbi:hypothetical protein OV203_05785 [Nannocystis sp. ILAH1]|nr:MULTISPECIES: hypothetical protein [unclassified Nannocystis]MCY0986620.1 hypothetical protein [Nannocystis sp. ILAH1]MCY1071501.1 hypothetical protein [Nannocystis sp. RBIL2]
MTDNTAPARSLTVAAQRKLNQLSWLDDQIELVAARVVDGHAG